MTNIWYLSRVCVWVHHGCFWHWFDIIVLLIMTNIWYLLRVCVWVYQGCFWHCIRHYKCSLSWEAFDLNPLHFLKENLADNQTLAVVTVYFTVALPISVLCQVVSYPLSLNVSSIPRPRLHGSRSLLIRTKSVADQPPVYKSSKWSDALLLRYPHQFWSCYESKLVLYRITFASDHFWSATV